MKNFIPFIAMLLLATSCNQKQVDTKAEGEKLMQASRDWAKAASNRDLEKTLSYWADDAIMISNSQPILNGKEAIRQMVEDSYKDSAFSISWEPLSANVSNDGTMGYIVERSTISFSDSSGVVTQHFNAVSVWRKGAAGNWKNVVDVMAAQ